MQEPLRAEPEARERLLARLQMLLSDRPGIVWAFVFGSFLDQPAFRDIDLAIWATSDAPRQLDVELASYASGALGVPVDVRLVNQAPVSFLFHVLRGRPLVVRDEEMLAALMERTAREYHDRAPLMRQAFRDAFGR